MRSVLIACFLLGAGCQSGDPDLCGNGTLEDGEECDDGNVDGSDACRACRVTEAVCGDAEVQRWAEECDASAPNIYACRPDCTLPSCFDGSSRAGDVCLGNGETLMSLGLADVSLELADLDGDDRLDLVMSRGGPDSEKALELAFNDGDGEFTRVTVALPDGSTGLVPLAIGDLDGDGLADIAVTYDDTLVLVRNLGARVLVPDSPIVLRAGVATDLEIGDVTGDAAADVITAHPATSQLTVLPAGLTPIGLVQTELSLSARELALGDFDADGVSDVVALGATELSFVFADGAELRVQAAGVVGQAAVGLRTAQLDANDRLDLVLRDSAATRVLLARADRVSFDVVDRPGFAASLAADVDADGHVDLVGLAHHEWCAAPMTCRSVGWYTETLLGRGDGSFGPELPYLSQLSLKPSEGVPGSDGGVTLLGLRAGDLDDDGEADLVSLEAQTTAAGRSDVLELRLQRARP